MPEPIILVRLFAEVGSEAEAEEEARLAESVLASRGMVARRRIERYWKIPEYWEIALDLAPEGPALAVYERLIGLAEAGWTIGEVAEEDEDRWAVWNPAPGVELLTPRTVWAELQLLPYGLPDGGDPDDFEDLDEVRIH